MAYPIADPNELLKTVTSPFFLVEFNFSLTLRYSTNGSVLFDSYTWDEKDIRVNFAAKEKPSIQVFNEGFYFGGVVLTDGTAGRNVSIWIGSGDVADFAPMKVFAGVMGASSVGDWVAIDCKMKKRSRTPRHFAVSPLVNHVPESGTRIETQNGIFILE